MEFVHVFYAAIYMLSCNVIQTQAEQTMGALSVTFREFLNPTGKAANGHCCDGRSWLCQEAGCDYIFKICLDGVDGINSTVVCQYGYKESGAVKESASVVFGDTIRDIDNPVIFPLHGDIPNVLALKIDVYDKDKYTDNDFVDFLLVTIPITNSVRAFDAEGTRRKHKTRLLGEISVTCIVGCEAEVTTIPTTIPTTTTRPPTTTDQGVVFIDRPNADCDNLAQNGYRYQDGVYQLRVAHFPPFPAYCDMSAEGWTVIQRRNDGSVNFFRSRHDYITGFGNIGPLTEYWLGLEKIYWLTNQRVYRLRITLRKADGTFVFAEYERFWIEADSTLHVEGYSGTAGDALNYPRYGGMRIHNGMRFSTFDHDADNWASNNCAGEYQSGWWFNDCYWANLNGPYIHRTNGWPMCDGGRCISWRTIEGYEDFALIGTEMEILPNHELNASGVSHAG